ncbi:MAG: BON domain-containing protein [Xanthomonadaceae bacterium]|nr:BON domain-containing protein [Xanthomonadaceae bacterium]
MRTSHKLYTLALAAVLGTAVACAPVETRQQPGEFLSDAWISTKVKTAMASSEHLRVIDVNVEVHDGVVQLSGFVDDESQIPEAEQVAREVEGVESVINDLQLKPRATG